MSPFQSAPSKSPGERRKQPGRELKAEILHGWVLLRGVSSSFCTDPSASAGVPRRGPGPLCPSAAGGPPPPSGARRPGPPTAPGCPAEGPRSACGAPQGDVLRPRTGRRDKRNLGRVPPNWLKGQAEVRVCTSWKYIYIYIGSRQIRNSSGPCSAHLPCLFEGLAEGDHLPFGFKRI